MTKGDTRRKEYAEKRSGHTRKKNRSTRLKRIQNRVKVDKAKNGSLAKHGIKPNLHATFYHLQQ